MENINWDLELELAQARIEISRVVFDGMAIIEPELGIEIPELLDGEPLTLREATYFGGLFDE